MKWISGVGLLLVLNLSGFTQDNSPFNGVIELDKIKKDVEYLSSKKLKGRRAGSKEEKVAAKYIEKRFREIGLQPRGEDGTFFQTVMVPENPDVHADTEGKKIEAHNVVGYINNAAKKTIIIGAHYDHLGMGEFNSFKSGSKEAYNGADDNASGVAALLELARLLKKENLNKNNYLFIAFTGEEMGLYGSKHFVKNEDDMLKVTNYMLNMDMVGRMNEEKKLIINGVGTSAVWKYVMKTIEVDSLKIITTESGMGPSDHTSFYLNQIPVLHFFTGIHADYHKPTDDADKINYEGIESVVRYIMTLISRLDDKLKLSFLKTKDEDVMSPPKFSVTLGVLPDYTFEGKGMRIDMVKENRPAAAAGIEDGDVVIKLDDHPVDNMKSYMQGLGKYKKGDKAKVRVRRGSQELDFDVSF